jgi:uncharacterized protein (TIGR02246 family)
MPDLDELKAAFEQATAALNRRDLEAFVSLHHDHIVFFANDAPFAVDGKAAFRQAWQALFANTESITITPINPQYRVLGTTGVIWMHTAAAVKPKDGPLRTSFSRFTLTYTQAEGKWLLVAVHGSAIPSGT